MDYLKQQLEEIQKKIEESKKLLADPELAGLARAEIADLERQKLEFEQSASSPMSRLPAEDTDSSLHLPGVNLNIAILEIRSAAGGDEAGIFAGDLLRMYTKFAQSCDWKMEELDRSEGNLGQIKEVVLKISGKDSFNSLQYESGVHRVQRVPKTES